MYHSTGRTVSEDMGVWGCYHSSVSNWAALRCIFRSLADA